MASVIDLKVPDLGDFANVPVIEILVKAGDRVEKDAPLVTLESEKATMEVPAAAAGVIRDVAVNVGDKVSTGSVIARVEAADASPAPQPAPLQAASPTTTVAPASTATQSAPASLPSSALTSIDLVVPDIGGFADVPIIDVLIKAGDRIERESPLVTLESEKATMDVPAEAGGVVRDVRVKVGDRVSKGSVIGTLSPAAGVLAPETTPRSNGSASASAPMPGAVTPAPSVAPSAPKAPAVPAHDGEAASGAAPVAHASPAIRRFARELGVVLSKLSGSGPNGRITREDVQSFVKRSLAAPAPSTDGGTALGLAPWPKVDFAQFGPIERTPLSRIRKISGPNLQRNWVLIPHVTQHDDADITDLEAFRQQLNGEQKDVKVTMLAFVMKGVVAALRKYPDFNSSLEGDELILKRYYNVGFAADTPGGLVVPVVRDVDRKGVLEVAGETAELAARAREAKLSMRDMQGGTFTISSLGGIGGTYFSPIINAPEVAILGVSRAAMRPVWDGKTFAPRLMLPLSLSYDHRVIDGAAAARFTVFLAAALADMRLTLL